MISKIRRCACACVGTIALAGCVNPHWTPASAFDEKEVVVVHVYDGPVRPLAEVATVYAFEGFERGEAQWVCSVDGKDLQKTIGLSVHCPSVVYLTPGRHLLGWRYHSGVQLNAPTIVGSSELRVDVKAGKVYELKADGQTKTTELIPRAPGFVVRFSDIRPTFPDTEIPN